MKYTFSVLSEIYFFEYESYNELLFTINTILVSIYLSEIYFLGYMDLIRNFCLW